MLQNPLQIKVPLGLYIFDSSQSPAVVPITSFVGRIIVFGVARDLTNNILTDTWEVLAEIPCSNLSIVNSSVMAQVPSFINVTSPNLLFILAATNLSTEVVLQNLPTNF